MAASFQEAAREDVRAIDAYVLLAVLDCSWRFSSLATDYQGLVGIHGFHFIFEYYGNVAVNGA